MGTQKTFSGMVRATVDSSHDKLHGTMEKLAGKVYPQMALTTSGGELAQEYFPELIRNEQLQK